MPELTVLNSSPHLTDPRANSKEDEEFQAFLKGAYEYAPRLHLDTESMAKKYVPVKVISSEFPLIMKLPRVSLTHIISPSATRRQAILVIHISRN